MQTVSWSIHSNLCKKDNRFIILINDNIVTITYLIQYPLTYIFLGACKYTREFRCTLFQVCVYTLAPAQDQLKREIYYIKYNEILLWSILILHTVLVKYFVPYFCSHKQKLSGISSVNRLCGEKADISLTFKGWTLMLKKSLMVTNNHVKTTK